MSCMKTKSSLMSNATSNHYFEKTCTGPRKAKVIKPVKISATISM